MNISAKTLIIGLVLVAVLGGAYLYFFSSSTEAPLSSTAPATPQEQQFLDVAAQLQPISFNTAIFSDPRFASLVDLTVPVTPEAQGRPDPFAPISGLSAGK